MWMGGAVSASAYHKSICWNSWSDQFWVDEQACAMQPLQVLMTGEKLQAASWQSSDFYYNRMNPSMMSLR